MKNPRNPYQDETVVRVYIRPDGSYKYYLPHKDPAIAQTVGFSGNMDSTGINPFWKEAMLAGEDYPSHQYDLVYRPVFVDEIPHEEPT